MKKKWYVLLVGAVAVSVVATSVLNSQKEVKKSVQFSTAHYTSLDQLVAASDIVLLVSVTKDKDIAHNNEKELHPLTLVGFDGVVDQIFSIRPDASVLPSAGDSITLGEVLLGDASVSEYANAQSLKSEMPSLKDQLILHHSQLIFGVGRTDSEGKKYVEVVASAMPISGNDSFKFGHITGSLSNSKFNLTSLQDAVKTMSSTPSPWK